MKSKKLIGSLLAASIVLSASFSGCSLVSGNSALDMQQVIASVNISTAENLSTADKTLFDNYKDAVGTTDIIKMELIAYYLNTGYSYVNSGLSYTQVFNMLVDQLVNNAVLTQYAEMYLLDKKAESSSKDAVLSAYTSKATYAEKLEYLLHDDTAKYGHPDDPDFDIKIAKYNLYSSVNSAIDSYETDIINEEEDEAGTDSRTVPGGVDSEQEDYYPKAQGKTDEGFEDGDLYYNVYTGYNGYLLKDSGLYKDEDVLEGSTRSTRIKAYNSFMSTLSQNSLVDPDVDDLKDIVNGVAYMDTEYVSQLESRVIEKYYNIYEAEQESKLTDDGAYDYLQSVYEDLKDDQQENNGTADAFKTAMDNMSDTSFVLYSPDTEGEGTYGYVYNILLPFNAVQSVDLTVLQSAYADKDNDGSYTLKYYLERNKLLEAITTTDQRKPWFGGATEYAFRASDFGFTPAAVNGDKAYYAGAQNDREWLFFENNLTKSDRYEPLAKYAGKYAYNGKAYKKEDGTYLAYPNQLTIDGMMAEFENYVNFVLGEGGSVMFDGGYKAGTKNEQYYSNLSEANFYVDKDAKQPEIDYKNFIYVSGKVDFADPVDNQTYRNNLLDKESAQYKALSAVNELQYAYTTDTAILSKYLGYTVTLGDTTGYIKEFEVAAHEAIARGAGAFTVCAGDYGWHLIYVTYTFGQDTDNNGSSNGGNEYAAQPNWEENINKEGTFENLFYEWVKSSDLEEISTVRRTQLINQFNKEETVTKYQSRYQDLLDLS